MFSDPERNIAQLALKEGDHVADLGAGAGFYSMAAAKSVGGSGRVFAIEVQRDMLDRIDKDIRAKGFSNIDVVWGDIEHNNGTRLRDSSMDAVIISNVIFQVDNPDAVISEARRIMKPDARLLLVDWTDSFGNMGPRPVQVFSQAKAESLLTNNGMVVVLKFDAGDHHYGLISKLP